MAISWFTIGILTIVCVLLVVVVIFQTRKLIKYIKIDRKKQSDVLGRRMTTTFRISALVIPLIVLIFYAGYYEVRWQYTQFMATVITRHIVGNDDVVARCTRRLNLNLTSLSIGPEGYVQYGSTHSEIGYNPCRIFADWLMSSREWHDNDVGMALHIIIHEAVHLTGEHDESMTECKSIMMHEDVAFETLGIDREDSRRFVEYYKNREDPLQFAMGYTVNWRQCEAAMNPEPEPEVGEDFDAMLE